MIYKDVSKRENYFKVDPYDYIHYGESKTLFKLNYDPQIWCNRIWRLHYHPLFIFKSAVTARNLDDIRLLLRGVRSLWGHIKDWAGIWK